jgi:Nucleotidyl transferase AbiEii toxin, Type IV TA system
MYEIATLPASERAELFQETAAKKGISSVVAIEKDFWVCMILGVAFDPSLIDEMVFKGGTSLSKVYGAINRFSEDIDLSLPRQALGFGHDLDRTLSRTKQGKVLDEIRAACDARVAGPLRMEMTDRVTGILGAATASMPWSIEAPAGNAGTLAFVYPPALAPVSYGAGSYVRPMVLLEFGGRNDVLPAESQLVRPYCLEVFPDLSTVPDCRVNVLAAERTFWEKATLLHAEFHRPGTSQRQERISRHYSDLAVLARHEIGTRALGRLDLLEAVAIHKRDYFPVNWARYDEARSGQLRLVPDVPLERELRIDYAAMREMFFVEPESFDDILEALRDLETRVNALTGGTAESDAVA